MPPPHVRIPYGPEAEERICPQSALEKVFECEPDDLTVIHHDLRDAADRHLLKHVDDGNPQPDEGSTDPQTVHACQNAIDALRPQPPGHLGVERLGVKGVGPGPKVMAIRRDAVNQPADIGASGIGDQGDPWRSHRADRSP